MISYKNRLINLVSKPIYDLLECRFDNFLLRNYQVIAIENLVDSLNDNENVRLLLDPGLGKTLVAQLTYISLHLGDPINWEKCLIIVPTRLLKIQHWFSFNWLFDQVSVLALTKQNTRQAGELIDGMKSADVIIATPQKLLNCLREDYRIYSILELVDLCVIDEFDALASDDVDLFGDKIGKLRESIKILIPQLTNNETKIITMSATQKEAAIAWDEYTDWFDIEVPKKYIGRHAAYVNLKPHSVFDENIIGKDIVIQYAILHYLRQLKSIVHGKYCAVINIDPNPIILQASKILQGNRRSLYCEELGGNIPLTSQVYSVLANILRANSCRLALYEGRVSDIEYQFGQVIGCIDEFDNEPIKLTYVKIINYTAEPIINQKTNLLYSIIRSRIGESVVVFTRYIDSNKYICKLLTEHQIDAISLHGELSDVQIEENMHKFKSGEINVIIVNREIGGRGFDLPQADYSIFLSPKRNNESMWQEMLRIRSSKETIKDIYILCFSFTRESNKLESNLEYFYARKDKCTIDEMAHYNFE